jgi:hypothetical protein
LAASSPFGGGEAAPGSEPTQQQQENENKNGIPSSRTNPLYSVFLLLLQQQENGIQSSRNTKGIKTKSTAKSNKAKALLGFLLLE